MRTLLIAFGLLAILAANSRISYPAEAHRSTLPEFATVARAFTDYFAQLPDYQPGDIISRSQAEAVLRRVEQLGFPLRNQKTLLAAVLADDEFLVVQLRTPAGRKFMRRISALPDVYDRMDRMARLPQGRQTIVDLIRGPGGEDLLKYLTTTPGGRQLGQQLSRVPQGANFQQPTGRIYTAAMLLERLKAEYEALRTGG
jgi:hypothetical protein